MKSSGKTSPQQIRVSRHQQSEAARQKEAENSRAFINRTHQKILDGLKDSAKQQRSVVSTRSGGSQTAAQTQRTSSQKPWIPSSMTPKVSEKGAIARLEGQIDKLKQNVEEEQSKEYRFKNMDELEYKLRLYVQTIINREMLPKVDHFEQLEKEMMSRIDNMVDKRVSVIQKQFDLKMKDIEAKSNAMLRMQMLELQRRTSGILDKPKNSFSEKKVSVSDVETSKKSSSGVQQDKVEQKTKISKSGEKSKPKVSVQQPEPQQEDLESESTIRLTQKERLAKMTEDLKIREQEIADQLNTQTISDHLNMGIKRRMSRQQRSGSRKNPIATAGQSYDSNQEIRERPTNIPGGLEQEDGPRRSSVEPLNDINIVNVGQEQLNNILTNQAVGKYQETSQDPVPRGSARSGSRGQARRKERSGSSQYRLPQFGDGKDPISSAFGDREKETGFLSGKVVSRHYQPEASTRMRLTGKGLVIPDPPKEEDCKPPTALDRLQEIQQAQLKAGREASGRKTTSDVVSGSPGLNYFKKEQPEWNGFVEPIKSNLRR